MGGVQGGPKQRGPTMPSKPFLNAILAGTLLLAGCGAMPALTGSPSDQAQASAKSGVKTPDWVKDAVFYQIFPERFANGNKANDPKGVEPWGSKPEYFNFMGGDLEGATQKLSYLKGLGIDAIYLNPIFTASSNHKYNTADYMHVDPHFGGDPAFKTFLRTAKGMGMKVILDGVFNHTGDDHLFFKDIKAKGQQSKYWNWYSVHGFPVVTDPKPNYNCWWGFGTLPQWKASTNREVQDYIFQVEEYWLKQGVDGWRLDVPNEIDNDDFWREFRRRAKAVNPDAYITGEIWTEADRWLQGDQFDSVMNYSLRNAMMGFFNGGYSGSHGNVPRLNADQFEYWINGLRNKYHREISYAQFNIMSSHDVERFLSIVGGDKRKLKLATLFQMTYPGAPVVYYGDEIGMMGAKDPENRKCFPTDASVHDKDLFAFYKKLIAVRHSSSALRTGDFRGILRHNDYNLYAFVREDKKEKVAVMLNNGDTTRDWSLDVSSAFPNGTKLKDAMTGMAYTVADGHVLLKMQPKQGFILVRD